MEIRQLEYFVSVVETSSFTKAAEKQYVSQPCVTHSIRKLEEELGIELFDRSQKKAQLTDEGRRFHLRACKLLTELRDTLTEMNELRNLARGTINLAIPPMIGSCLFPYLFTSFQTHYPQLTLNVYEEGSFAAHRLIEQEELDLGIIILPEQGLGTLETVYLTQQEILLAVALNHPLANEKSVPFSTLRQEKFILFKSNFFQRHLILDRCQQAGIEPNIVFNSSQIETVKSLVTHGVGISFLMEMALAGLNGIVGITLDPPLYVNIGLAWKKGRQLSASAKAFINLVSAQTDAALSLKTHR
jgi:DNA-binding transcriptional LysR family regulator